GAAVLEAPQIGASQKKATAETNTALSDAANWTLDTQDVIDSYQEEAEINDYVATGAVSDRP
ncbi:hypothetical protein, partial [Psychrobacter proteolyticus]|uniref:hypothetical protein n=1 Tax=Psychrobacter proteolyticus TaxID=147825 RepID=UPI00311FE619